MAVAPVRRREFLKLMGGVSLLRPRPAVWREARDVVRRGRLGDVVFCRVLQDTVADAVDALRFLFDGALPLSGGEPTLRYSAFVAAYEEAGSRGEYQIVLCGTEATLVVDRRGCRVYQPEA